MEPTVNADDVAENLAEPLRSYLRRYCGDPQLAEDLAQETLLRAVRSLPSFDGRSSLRTWGFAIATRVAADHYRSRARSVPETPVEDTSDLVGGEGTADSQLIVDEMNACVRDVIDTLPGDYRAALVLRDLEGLPVAEVAEVLDCSLATAKIRIHRARKRLQDALGGACEFYKDADNVFRCDRR